MGKEKNSIFMPAFIYAGIITGVYIIFSIIVDVMGAYFSVVNMIGMYIILFVSMAYAMYSYRKEYKANTITYGRAFGFGMLVSLILVVFIGIYSWIYISYINPDILELSRNYTYQKLLDRGLSENMIEDQMEMMERFQKPPLNLIWSSLGLIFYFTIANLIIAAFIKKEPSDPFAEIEE